LLVLPSSLPYYITLWCSLPNKDMAMIIALSAFGGGFQKLIQPRLMCFFAGFFSWPGSKHQYVSGMNGTCVYRDLKNFREAAYRCVLSKLANVYISPLQSPLFPPHNIHTLCAGALPKISRAIPNVFPAFAFRSGSKRRFCTHTMCPLLERLRKDKSEEMDVEAGMLRKLKSFC
jgi:hypothetical protein